MIGLLGSGSWATAIVKILLENPTREIYWWVREPDIIESLRTEYHNSTYLSEVYIDTARVHLTPHIEEVAAACDDIFLVIPSAFVAGALEPLGAEQLRGKHIISAVKGIVPEHNLIVTDYLQQHLGVAEENMAVISGPSHAEETARNRLTYLTVASTNETLTREVQHMLNCSYLKTTCSTDVRGVEYGTVLKNIYAIATGILHGMGYGDNIIAVLISNAIREMDYFLEQVCPQAARNTKAFAYLGDLLVTCYSQFSRNRTFGSMVGYGYTVKAAQLEMKMVAEGYYAVACVEKMRSSRHLSLPIEQAVYNILYKNHNNQSVIRKLIESLQ